MPTVQLQRQQQEVWDTSSRPAVGQRLDCLDVFLDYRTNQTASVWRPAVVIDLRTGATLQIKLRFQDSSSSVSDKWVLWPLERNQLASLGTGGSRTPTDLGYVPYDRAAVRSATDSGGGDTGSGTGGWTDGSPAGSSISGGGGGGGYGSSSAGGAAAATVGRRKGFGRFKVFGAMKSLLRPQADVERAKNGGGNSSTERGTPTPPFDISPAPSFSPTNPVGVRVVASGGGGGGGG
ncbi:unnamed protein product, partial [Ectocarpus sp. 8 AP-2014]